jgi:signal peptidase I
MTELTADKKHRRKPLTAIVLSLIMPGLGHVYCGRIVRGIILAFLSSIFIPVIFGTLSVSQYSVRIVVIIVSLFASLVVWLVAIIDSWYTARHTADNYTLKDYNRWYVYIILILMSTGSSTQIAFNVRASLVEAFRITAVSMHPTIVYGDRFLANKIAYNNSDPERGDVIVFKSPENRRSNWVKRVVAIAGDTVEMKDNELYINGQKLERESVGQSSCDSLKGAVQGELFLERNGQTEYKIFLADIDKEKMDFIADFPQTTIPKNHCFVLGDNRNLSRDSRHFESVPLATIKGKADYLYWPAKSWSRFGRIEN